MRGFLTVLLFVILLGVALATSRDYGITTDEGVAVQLDAEPGPL